MVKAFFTICLILCSLGIPARALPPSDSTGTTAAAQDGTGTVWALPADGSYGILNCWQAGSWVPQPIPGAADFRPLVLTRGGDGSVYALWQSWIRNQPRHCLVTVQRGIGSRVLARFSGSVLRDAGFSFTPTIYAGVGGDVWVAGYQPLLWHISPDGAVKAFPLKPEQYFGGTLPDNLDSPAIASLTDGAGRRWFWQDGARSRRQRGSLRGVLIWDGKTLAYHPTLLGVPDQPILVISSLDANHLWLATGDNQSHGPDGQSALYQIDTRTLSAVPESAPLLGTFKYVTQVFRADGDWYAVDQPYDPKTILWRKRSGQWRPYIDRLQKIGSYRTPDLRHPWVAEPSGVWLGVDGGAWWLPRDDRPALWVNWRRGLPALYISGLFPLTDGRLLAAGEQGAAEIPATPQPVQPMPPGLVFGGLDTPKGLESLVADPRSHLWGIRSYYAVPLALAEWDGQRWRTHVPPKNITGITRLYACDARGRLWLATTHWNPPAQPQPVEGRLVYDPATDTWTNYDTVPEALCAAAQPGMAFFSVHDPYPPPVFSRDGRIVYINGTTLFHYDGSTWREWEIQGMLPEHTYPSVTEGPHFTDAGRLELALDNCVMDWTPEAGWQQTGERKAAKYDAPVPPGGPPGLSTTGTLGGIPVVDGLGEKWFVWQGAVYTTWYGLWTKQEDLSGPGSPFRYGYGIDHVLRDPTGRLFFETHSAGYTDLIAWSPPPVPPPTLAVVPTSDDSVAVHLQAKMNSTHWYLWRVNGGAWSVPQTMDTVNLTGLPQGDYHIEVQALDRRLQPSPPAAALFSIHIVPSVQVTRWVRALLSGTDAAREAAVAGLLKQPDIALPALQSARPGASDDGRWWLDAAIQQIMASTEH